MQLSPFSLVEPKGGESAVVVEVPHAGTWLPSEVLATLVAPAHAIARDADLYVDELYEDAPSEGATLLVAHISRYACDLNRAADDVDGGVVKGDPRPFRPHARGLVWRTTTEDEPALLRPLHRDELEFRLTTIHRPYHAALASLLHQKIQKFGFAILLCAHSMPSVGRAGHLDAGVARADVVPGTRGRTSACGRVIEEIDRVARKAAMSVAHDKPYKGGFSTTFYGRPSIGCHAIQIELARRLYLDETTLARKPAGMKSTREVCRRFVASLTALKKVDLV